MRLVPHRHLRTLPLARNSKNYSSGLEDREDTSALGPGTMLEERLRRRSALRAKSKEGWPYVKRPSLYTTCGVVEVYTSNIIGSDAKALTLTNFACSLLYYTT